MNKVEEGFQQELSIWDTASKNDDPNLTIQYLIRYPSGFFCELAEVRLDQLLAKRGERKLIIQNSSENPFSKGTVSGAMKYSVGNTYSFVTKDFFTGIEVAAFIEKVTKVSDNEIVFNDGWRVIDSMGNDIVSPNERFLSPAQYFPASYAIGNKWVTRYGWRKSNGVASSIEMEFKVTNREKIETSAGKFNAFVVEGTGFVVRGNRQDLKYWIDPESCNRPIWFDRITKHTKKGEIKMSIRSELVLFQQ